MSPSPLIDAAMSQTRGGDVPDGVAGLDDDRVVAREPQATGVAARGADDGGEHHTSGEGEHGHQQPTPRGQPDGAGVRRPVGGVRAAAPDLRRRVRPDRAAGLVTSGSGRRCAHRSPLRRPRRRHTHRRRTRLRRTRR
jgi:hypothetical protein